MKTCPTCDLILIEMYDLNKRTKGMGCALHGIPDIKGDVAGHEFHGNQYTGGMGGGSEAPIHCASVKDALRLLGEGHKVELAQPREVSTLLDKLAKIAAHAAAKGLKAPHYNLCDISVPGTNIFCADNKGIIRDKMPQLSGIPKPGSPGDKLPKDKNGEVNIMKAFLDKLKGDGTGVKNEKEQAAYLRATQKELDGVKVAGLMKMLEKNGPLDAPLIISKDNYILDGHHHWAAQVGMDERTNKDHDPKLHVIRVNMAILPLVDAANKFAKSMGIPHQSAWGKGLPPA